MIKKLKKHKNGYLREDKKDKLDYTLIPIEPLKALAKHYTDGAKVHGDWNWKKCVDMNSFKSSAYRHLIAVLEDDTTEDHISACIWNLMALKYNQIKNDK
jgi:Domain of unknown function (DUF5664)